MRFSLIRLVFIIAILVAGCGAAAAQAADGGPLFPQGDEKNEPFGFREMMKKLEIDRQKKDFEEMQDRGKQALELSNELENAVGNGQSFTEDEKAKLETLEKLVKRIRHDLGGSDDDRDDDDCTADVEKKPSSIAEGFKSLQAVTVKLVDELQKTSRFTVSTAAIRSSNAVLRMTRYLRFWK